MTTRAVIAVLLLAMGILAFAFTGINYTTRDPSLIFAAVQERVDSTLYTALPPIAGAIAIITGIILLVQDERRFALGGTR